jgi:hypothetical protein
MNGLEEKMRRVIVRAFLVVAGSLMAGGVALAQPKGEDRWEDQHPLGQVRDLSPHIAKIRAADHQLQQPLYIAIWTKVGGSFRHGIEKAGQP